MPIIPAQCPFNAGDDVGCDVRRHHWRVRSTGPKHPLAVLFCHTHQLFFTVYPPGHVPYGRTALVALSPEGSRVNSGDENECIPVPSAFASTLFEAAWEGASGPPWPRYFDQAHHVPRFSTQTARLKRAASLLGIEPAQPATQTIQIAGLLEVAGQVQHDAQTLIARHPGYKSRSLAICHLLNHLSLPPPILSRRLAECGHCIGLWAMAHWWDGKWWQTVFPAHRTRGPPASTIP